VGKTVYVLGSGFSKPAGAPTGEELLPSIVRWARGENPHPQPKRFLSEVVEALSSWLGNLETYDFEQVLTILSSETLFETLTERPFEEARLRRPDLIWAALFAIKQGIGENRARFLYDEFVATLRPNDSIVSLNYDVIVEDALIRKSNRFDAGVPPEQVLDSLESFVTYAGTPVLKIHGSANLMRCESCGKWLVKGWKIAEDVLVPWDHPNSRYLTCMECKGNLAPVIVPPALEKARELVDVKVFWRRALQELRSADRAVFIGCGLRPADFDLEMLLKTALRHRSSVPIDVVCRTGRVAARYRELFPSHPINVFPGGFERWIAGAERKHEDNR
jgi:hypothetical protein